MIYFKILSLKQRSLYTLQGLSTEQSEKLAKLSSQYLKISTGFMASDFLTKDPEEYILTHDIGRGLMDHTQQSNSLKQIIADGFDWTKLRMYPCGKSIWCKINPFTPKSKNTIQIRINAKILNQYAANKKIDHIYRWLKKGSGAFIESLPYIIEDLSRAKSLAGFIFNALLRKEQISLVQDNFDTFIVKIKNNNFEIIN